MCPGDGRRGASDRLAPDEHRLRNTVRDRIGRGVPRQHRLRHERRIDAPRLRRVVCAAPSFLASHGAPRDPRALADLPCLIYGTGAAAIAWSFRKPSGARARVEVRGPVRSNNLELLVALAEAGHGVARLPDWAVRESIAAERLVPLLAAWAHEPERERPALYALHPADPGKDRLRRSFLAALEEVARRGVRPAQRT